MAKVYISSKQISKYLYYITLFNAIFPKVLEESDLTLWVEDPYDNDNVHCLSYDRFLEKFDSFGLNQAAI